MLTCKLRIVALPYYEAGECLSEFLAEAMGRAMTLRPEPTNEFDVNAIRAYDWQGRHVGYANTMCLTLCEHGRLICDCDGLGLQQTDFVTMTTEQIENPWSSWASDLMGSLFSQDKKTVEVYDDKIVYNDMTQRYW